MTDLNVPEQAYEAAYAAVLEFNAVAKPTAREIASDVVRAAAPLVERAVLETVVGRRGDLPYDEWATTIADRAVARLAKLRAGQS